MSTAPPQNGKYYTKDDPAMDKYRSAWDTLHTNIFVNNPDLTENDRIYLRGIQGTWKVKQEHWPDQGYNFQLMLVWDHDRIWGAFDLGYYKGILMVDHGPEREPPEFSREYDEDEDDEGYEDQDPVYFNFTWRGTCTKISDTALNNPLITKGKIEFGPIGISGYFDGMGAVGFPNERCDFDGRPVFGPRRVSRTLQSFIDDWNGFNILGDDETMRQVTSSGDDTFSEQPE
jgi:hypothetical protein